MGRTYGRNMKIKYNSKPIIYHRPIVDGDDIWVSSACNNSLYIINNKVFTCKFINTFPNEDFNRKFLHATSAKYENKLVFVPFAGKYITVFEIDKNKMSNYRLKNYTEKLSSLFYTSVLLGKTLYLVPCRYEYIVEFDMSTHELHEYKIFENNRKSNTEILPFVLKAACIYKKSIIIGTNYESTLIDFNLETKEIYKYSLPYDLAGISNIEFLNNEIWIFGKNGKIVYGDIETNIFNEFGNIPKYKDRHYGRYFETLILNNDIYVTESYDRKLYKIDTYSKQIKLIIEKMGVCRNNFCPVN